MTKKAMATVSDESVELSYKMVACRDRVEPLHGRDAVSPVPVLLRIAYWLRACDVE